jgi:molybdopterin-containing oxidoreductase family membrane subunit
MAAKARNEILPIPMEAAPLRALRLDWPWFITMTILLAAVGWGAYNLIFQQWAKGLEVTGLNVSIYWGLYIVNFVFLIGVSAGGIIVGALAYAAGIERFRPVARIAELMAISCLILATLFIFVSIGAPDRFYFLFVYWRLGSPLIWDVLIVLAYLGLAMVLGYFGTRADLVRVMNAMPGRRWLYRVLVLGYTDVSPQALEHDRKILRALAMVSVPAAVLLHSITAWILGVVKARVTWHTSLLGPLFVVSAVVSGLGLVIVSAIVARGVLRFRIRRESILELGKLLAFSIPVLGYFLFAELLTVTFGKEPTQWLIFREMIWGHFAPVFWSNLILGLLVPLLILISPLRKTITGVGIASALVVLGVFLERSSIVILPQLHRLLFPFYPAGSYTPTGVELSIAGGIYALGALFFVLCAKLFPLVELEEGRG